ncbi:hypothetical protein LHYA1_G001975 [Lachnellula hyalina]|uniref:Uncharacterized protein n=1 Tax=Lachnellula hyalina TaxID=1316788 RepID=A0A8H8U2X2_9HELO|nr:uncharacterized protein LHYA1_G001975 [Lachnellula hyalina]TVY28541.1 hypothetical protein LHYA1_G001975 [Lachnellula hyalina]
MPTPLDKALNSKNAFLVAANVLYEKKAFTGVVTAAAVWSIWGTEMFPKESDPTGGMFSTTPSLPHPSPSPIQSNGIISLGAKLMGCMTRSKNMDPGRAAPWRILRIRDIAGLVAAVLTFEQRNLYPNSQDTNEQLLERVQANMRTPRQ